MRAGLFLVLLFVLLVAAAMRIRPPANERAKTLRTFSPSLETIARRLPPHATIGLLGIHINDPELLNEVRWMLYPRTVNHTIAERPWEQDTLLIISTIHEADTVSPRILSRSRHLITIRDSTCSYQLMLPEKERR